MTFEEAKKAIDGFKENGMSEEEIVARFYLMFQEDKINVKELGDLVGLVGWGLTDEFLAMSPEDQKTKVFEEDEETLPEKSDEKTTEEENTDKEPSEEKTETDDKTSSEENIEPDDSQEEKALKLFGLK